MQPVGSSLLGDLAAALTGGLLGGGGAAIPRGQAAARPLRLGPDAHHAGPAQVADDPRDGVRRAAEPDPRDRRPRASPSCVDDHLGPDDTIAQRGGDVLPGRARGQGRAALAQTPGARLRWPLDPTSRYASLPDDLASPRPTARRGCWARRASRPEPPLRGTYQVARRRPARPARVAQRPATRPAGGCSPTRTRAPTRRGSSSPGETIDLPRCLTRSCSEIDGRGATVADDDLAAVRRRSRSRSRPTRPTPSRSSRPHRARLRRRVDEPARPAGRRRRRRSSSRSRAATSTYRFEGMSTAASWTIDAAGGSQLYGQGDRPDARARPARRRSSPGPARSDSAIAEAIFCVLRALGAGRADAGGPRSGRPRRAPARQRPGVPARARDEVGLRASTSSATDGRRRRALPPDRPARRPAGRAVARVRRATRCTSSADAELVDGQRVQAVADPRALGLRAGRRLERETTRRRARTSLGGADDDAADAGRRRRASSTRSSTATGARAPLGVRRHARPSRSTPTGVGLLLRARKPCSCRGSARRSRAATSSQRVRHIDRRSTGTASSCTLVRNALGLKGNEPFGRRRARRAAVTERFTGKYLGDRGRQRRPEEARAASRSRCPRSSATRPPAGALPCSPFAGHGVGPRGGAAGRQPRLRRVAGRRHDAACRSGRAAPGPTATGVQDAGPDDARARHARPGTRSSSRDTSGSESIEIDGGLGREDHARLERRHRSSSGSQKIALTQRVDLDQRRRARGDVMAGFMLDAATQIICPHGGQGDGDPVEPDGAARRQPGRCVVDRPVDDRRLLRSTSPARRRPACACSGRCRRRASRSDRHGRPALELRRRSA